MNKILLPVRLPKAGMTLMEIIIVVALLGTLGVFLITNLTDQADSARIDQTKLAMNNIRQALQLYRMHMKRYPSDDQGLQALLDNPGDKRWRGPYLDSEKKTFDPWDIEIEYQRDGRDYKLISAGPDQEIGTEDDIVYPEEETPSGGEQGNE